MTLAAFCLESRFEEVQFKEIKPKGQDEIGCHPMRVIVVLETGKYKKHSARLRQDHAHETQNTEDLHAPDLHGQRHDHADQGEDRQRGSHYGVDHRDSAYLIKGAQDAG